MRLDLLPFRTVLMALAASVGLVGSAALADDLTGTLKKIKDSGAITIGNRESSVPFSYLDEHGTPIGYSVDLCNRVVEEVKKTLSLPDLKVQYITVAPAARIPLLSNGTIDLECSTTDRTLARMRQVAFSVPTFVIGGRILTKIGSGITDWGDLHAKVIGVAQGTHTEQLVNALVATPAYAGTRVLTLKDHAQGLLALETGRVDAYVTDDIVLYGLRGTSRMKDQLTVTGKQLSVDTYGIVLRRDDPDFEIVVDRALSELYRSPEIEALYHKWFDRLGVPMSDENKCMYQIGALGP
jgi:glutamate/aspartate transport system substrate-binding protein